MEEKTANMAENIRVTFTGFHYIKDDDYPNDFEVGGSIERSGSSDFRRVWLWRFL